MKTIKHTSSFYIWASVLGFLLFLLDSTSMLSLRIGNAKPQLLIPLLIAVAMAAKEWIGLIFGASFGILLDTIGAETLSFNMIMLTVIGCGCGLLCAHFVNDNIFAALTLSFFANLFYFFVRWFFFYVCADKGEVFSYLWRYVVPTVIYNALFIIPFYLLMKYISKRTCYFN